MPPSPTTRRLVRIPHRLHALSRHKTPFETLTTNTPQTRFFLSNAPTPDHTQTMLAAENSALPPFRRFMDDRRYSEAPGRYPIESAYVEGWGLYAESLGAELGQYTDPYQLVGRLSMEMWRACR